MIQAVLFDFNGVVIDDEPLQMKAFQEVLRGDGVSLTEEEYYGSLGMDDATFVRAAFERAGREADAAKLEEVIGRKTEIHRALMKDGLPIFPGVVNFIRVLRHRYPLGLVSMARRPRSTTRSKRAGLQNAFEVVVSAGDVQCLQARPRLLQPRLKL